MGDNQGVIGQQRPSAGNSEFNQTRFQTDQALGEVRTLVHGKILKVYNRNSTTEPCTVDWQPIIKQVDGAGKASSHGTVYGTPVSRSIGGDSMIVNDPDVGDVGMFGISDRDTKSAQTNDWKESNPGSGRRFSFSDATFHGTMPRKSQTIKQSIVFDDTGVTIKQRDGHKIVMQKSGINLNGVVIDKDGNVAAPGNMTAGKGTADQVTLQGHTHAAGPAPSPGT